MQKAARAKDSSTRKSINEYLACVPQPARSTLIKTRAAIKAAAPSETTETISYGMPAFKYKGILVWYAAFADHCSLFPSASIVEAFKDDLKDFSVSKGTIRFPLDKPLPAALVKRLVRARVELNESKKKR
jgi:uncharacterized protein YdhG (YjbR/CyaY superfamily)